MAAGCLAGVVSGIVLVCPPLYEICICIACARSTLHCIGVDNNNNNNNTGTHHQAAPKASGILILVGALACCSFKVKKRYIKSMKQQPRLVHWFKSLAELLLASRPVHTVCCENLYLHTWNDSKTQRGNGKGVEQNGVQLHTLPLQHISYWSEKNNG